MADMAKLSQNTAKQTSQTPVLAITIDLIIPLVYRRKK
jgi:hypothetical protein